jgi:prevent-host-death family protein
MKSVTLSDAKMNLSILVDIVRSSNTEVVVTKNGSPSAVLMSYAKFESWKETVTVRSDAALMREIKAGLKALKAKKARFYSLEELF